VKSKKFVSCLLVSVMLTGFVTGCSRKVKRDYKLETEKSYEFDIEDEINDAILAQSGIVCLVNNNEIRVYDYDGELLDSKELDGKSKRFESLGDGFFCAYLENGDVQVIRVLKSSSKYDVVNLVYKTHFDKEIIDVTAKEGSTMENSLYYFLTSDYELYGAGINLNQILSKDLDEGSIILEPVKIRDDFGGFYDWIGADKDGNTYNIHSWEKIKTGYTYFNGQLVSENLQYGLCKGIVDLQKNNPDVLDDMVIGDSSGLYKDSGKFYYIGSGHNAKNGNQVHYSGQEIDLPDGYEYYPGVSGEILCYDEHNFLIYTF